MTLQDIIRIIEKQLTKLQAEKTTGKYVVEFNLKEGGIGETYIEKTKEKIKK